MNPGKLTRPRFFLAGSFRDEIILDAVDRQKLRVIEVADHPVMGKILEQKGKPAGRVGAHREVDIPSMDLGIDIDIEFLRLGGDRLPRSSSAILGDLGPVCAHMENGAAGALPLRFFYPAVDLGRFSLPGDEIRIEMKIG